jgi:translation initiation factor 3 subunit M
MYNSVSDEGWRFAFLKAAFTFGRATKQFEALAVIFDTLEDRLNQQFNKKTTAAQRRELLQLSSEIAREGKTDNAVAVHLKYLKSFDGEDASKIPASAIEHAKAVVGDALLNPSVFQFDHLVSSNVVKALSNGATKPFFELLQIFASQNYDAYVKFVAANKSVIESLGAEADAALSRKIRLLTVVSIASAAAANGSAIIGADGVAVSTSVSAPYSSFASALQVSEEDVEAWVIDAVTAEILDAKLDQLHNSVQISYAMQRTFDMSNWKQLGEKLTAWKENIRGMLKVIHNARDQTLADVVQ